MPVRGSTLEDLVDAAVCGRGFIAQRVAVAPPFISGASVCSQHCVVHVVGACTRVPVCGSALESLIHAATRRSGLFARRVAHLAAFPALSFPQVTDTTSHPVRAGGWVEVDRATGEVLVCTAIGSVLHFIAQGPA